MGKVFNLLDILKKITRRVLGNEGTIISTNFSSSEVFVETDTRD